MTTKTVQLGEVCEFVYGEALSESNRRSGKVPVFGSNGVVGWHNEALTTGATIVIGRKGSIGEVNWSTDPCFPIDTTYYIETTKRPCDLRWLYYALLTLDLTRLDRSTAIPGLNRDDAHEQRIVFPELPEQRRIVERLDQADRLRCSRRYALGLTDAVLPSVFIDMFGNPVTNPLGWEVCELGALGDLDRGRSQHRPRNAPELLGGPHPLIQTGDVANSNGYIREYKQTYSALGLEQSKMWPRGTLCITIAANIAKTGILLFDSCFPDSVVGFTPKPKTNVEYVQQWFSFVQRELERTAPESAQKNINLEILRGLLVPLPPLKRQEEFSVAARKVEHLRALDRESLRQAEHLFASLLHNAFAA